MVEDHVKVHFLEKIEFEIGNVRAFVRKDFCGTKEHGPPSQ